MTVGGSCLTSDGSCLLLADMLSNGPMRGSMQQGWGPQGHMGGSGGALMGQGMGPARMLPGMRGLPGSRGLVSMQMMGSGEDLRNHRWFPQKRSRRLTSFSSCPSDMEMASPAYPQQHAPPNQTAPWPEQMLSMDHYGGQSRSGLASPPHGGRLRAGPEEGPQQ